MNEDATELERRFAELAAADDVRRADLLLSLQATRPQLAQRLARLLDAHAAAEDPLAALENVAITGRLLFTAEEQVGRRLGDWTLLRVIGRGGMGVVYAAESIRDGVERTAAVKLLAIPLFDQRATDHFLQEARALARLTHPGICRLLDWGCSDEGWPYLVLQLVQGETLDRHVAGRPLRERLELLAEVADTVAAAHRDLIAHLDLKPANILVGCDGRSVLLDFGVSRMLDEERGLGTTLARWLTPRYASPEQLRGAPASASADLHALGVMLFELATHVPPFDLEGVSLTEALRRMERGAVPPSRLDKRLPRDLDAICARAMHPDPTRRYVSADAFADDLRALLSRRPVSVRRDTLRYRVGRLFARNPVVAPLAVLAASAIVGLAALMAMQAHDLRLEFLRAERAAARAAAATDFLLDSLDAVDPKTLSGTGVGLAQLLDAAERRLAQERLPDARLGAQLHLQIGRIRAATGRGEQALAAYDAGLSLLDGTGAGEQRSLIAELHDQRARALRSLGRLDDALAAADVAVALAEGEEPRLRVRARRGRSHVLEQLGRYEEADAVTRESMQLVPGTERALLAELHNDLAASGLARTDFRFAAEHARRALELHEAIAGEPTLERTEAAWRLAAALLNLGRVDEARPLIEDAVAVRTRLYGPRDHRVGEVLMVLSNVQDLMGERDEALQSALETESIYEATLDPGSPRLMSAYGAVGNQLLYAGRAVEAGERFGRGLALARTTYGEAAHPATAFFINALGDVCVARGDHAGALQRYRETLSMMQAIGMDSGNTLMWTRIGMARALLGLGRDDEALVEAAAALSVAQAELPEGSWERAVAQSRHAHALLRIGRVREAEEGAQAAERLLGSDDSPAQTDARLEHARLMLALHERRGDGEAIARVSERILHLEAPPAISEGRTATGSDGMRAPMR